MLAAVRLAALLMAANPSPPTVVAPANNELLCTTDVSFNGSATPPNLSTNTVNVAVGAATASANVSGSGAWSTQLTVPDGGDYTASVTETVAAAIGGGTGTSTPTIVDFRVELAIDPPALSQPATNGQVYVTAQPLIAGSAQAGSRVTLELANALLADAGAAVLVLDGGTWSGPLATGASGRGTYALHTWTDSNDACAVTSGEATRAMTIDTTPATLDSLDAGAALNTSAAILAGAGVPTTQVLVTVNDAGTLVDVPDSGRWQLPATLAEGPDTLTVQDLDVTGGRSAATTIGVTVYLTHIDEPANDATTDPQVTFSGTAAPGTSISLSVTSDGGPVPGTANVATDGSWSCTLTLDPGVHTATAVDLAGGFSGSSATVSFTVVPTSTTTTSTSTSASTSTSGTTSASASSASSSGATTGTTATASSSGAGATTGTTGSAGTTGEPSAGSTSSGATSVSSSSSAASTSGSGSAASGNTGGSAAGGSSGSTEANPSFYRACGCASDDGPVGLAALLLVAAFTRGRRRP